MSHSQPETGHFHAVRFYESTDSLSGIVAGFVTEGLVAGQPAVVIATAAHREAIRLRLGSTLDLDRLEREGDLVFLDASEMLAKFMVAGMPDSTRFDAAMLPVLDAVGRGRENCLIRAYGEIVDVLWKAGQETAAIRLEMLWNQLALKRKFSLLCGYSMGSFYKDAAFEDICSRHTHVVSAGGTSAPVKDPIANIS